MITNLSFSQTGYPKKILIDNDTVVAITNNQLQVVNNLKVDYDECKEVVDTLKSQVSRDSILIMSQFEFIRKLSNEMDTQGDIIENEKAKNSKLTENLKQSMKLYNRQRIKTAVVGGLFTVSLGVIVALLIVH